MKGNRLLAILLVMIISSSCGGSGFIPAPGPYSGEFMVEGVVVGALTLTTTSGLLGGGGTLIHNDQQVTVSISATINDKDVSGTISNASLGSGLINGSFTGDKFLSGQFNYQDIGGISITTGTWTATTHPGT